MNERMKGLAVTEINKIVVGRHTDTVNTRLTKHKPRTIMCADILLVNIS